MGARCYDWETDKIIDFAWYAWYLQSNMVSHEIKSTLNLWIYIACIVDKFNIIFIGLYIYL